MEQRCGPFIFFSNFDSGNISRVEKSEFPPTTVQADAEGEKEDNPFATPEVKVDYAFNVWASPDCAGTQYQNGNRSWFHFGIRGSLSSHTIRITVMNMNRQSKLYSQGYNVIAKFHPTRPTWERLRTKPSYKFSDSSFMLTFTCTFPHACDTAYFAFCYPWSYEESQSQLSLLDNQFGYCCNRQENLPADTIYYYRETICRSLQGRKVDLITISDYSNMLPEPEPRFDSRLFPDCESNRKDRCRAFKNKRVFILTSRVHPGETPASFVFNGFLNFILRSGDFRARRLRQLFVFKLIPMLNPDGVYCGHYRTDSRGVNLNRVYLDPSWDLFPTIYAVKSMIVFHHVNNRVKLNQIEETQNNKNNGPAADPPTEEPSTASGDFGSLTVALEKPTSSDQNEQPEASNQDFLSSISVAVNEMSNDLTTEEFSEKQQSDIRKSSSAPLFRNNPSQAATVEQRLKSEKSSVSSQLFGESDPTVLRTSTSKVDDEVDFKIGNEGSDDDDVDFTPSLGAPEVFKNAPHLCDKSLLEIPSALSGIAFYVDLHGHASKRGCFIYGNHLEDETSQVDNVTFAKLISLNSQHFDFEACNFTEKNMYARDRHDNSTKEGAGRVAIHKAIGIIHSYTLECNYNMGRITNALVGCVGPGSGRTTPPPPPSYMPTRYTPGHFEEVGRGVAIAALDMLQENPCSRLPNTEFNCLNRVKEWVRYRVLAGKAETRAYRSSLGNPSSFANGGSGNKVNAVSNGQNSFKHRSFSMPSTNGFSRPTVSNKIQPKGTNTANSNAPTTPATGNNNRSPNLKQQVQHAATNNNTPVKQQTSPAKRTHPLTSKLSPYFGKVIVPTLPSTHGEEVFQNNLEQSSYGSSKSVTEPASKWPSIVANGCDLSPPGQQVLASPKVALSFTTSSPAVALQLRQPQQLLSISKVEPSLTVAAPASSAAAIPWAGLGKPATVRPPSQTGFRMSAEKVTSNVTFENGNTNGAPRMTAKAQADSYIESLRRSAKRSASRGYNYLSNSHAYPSSPALNSTNGSHVSKSVAAPNHGPVQRQRSADAAVLHSPTPTNCQYQQASEEIEADLLIPQDSTDEIAQLFEYSTLGKKSEQPADPANDGSITNNGNSNVMDLEISDTSVFPRISSQPALPKHNTLTPATISFHTSTATLTESNSHSNNGLSRFIRRRNICTFQHRPNGTLGHRSHFRQAQSPIRRKK